MVDISILCITKAEPHVDAFVNHYRKIANAIDAELVVALDCEHAPVWSTIADISPMVKSDGYLESVLDIAVSHCSGDYVFRMDDDESFSQSLIRWLIEKQYARADHWAFPRAHLWQDGTHYITNAPLWPDVQTRLSLKEMSGNRKEIHSGSPFGTGHTAHLCPILHHKFLIRSYEEREKIAEKYESVKPGAGSGHFGIFSLPEKYLGTLEIAEL